MWFIRVFNTSRSVRAPWDWESDVVGYFPTEEEAMSAVIENLCDIQEARNELCMIGYIPAGLYQTTSKERWFKWNANTKKWQLTHRPEILKQIAFSL